MSLLASLRMLNIANAVLLCLWSLGLFLLFGGQLAFDYFGVEQYFDDLIIALIVLPFIIFFLAITILIFAKINKLPTVEFSPNLKIMTTISTSIIVLFGIMLWYIYSDNFTI